MIDQMFVDAPVEAATRIAILDENTANQIAAGEVIERPASVVKELVENAIDAEATRITIELEGSGKQLIRVTDNGCGMCQEDAILSLQRHATSKIRTATDLESIQTMGFRGEALPSIASVAQVSVTTLRDDSSPDTPGTQILLTNSRIEDIREVGARVGTSITVENLFYNVPARLKFLKSDSTELNQINDLVQNQALARPGIAFRLLHNNQELFSTDGAGRLTDVCLQVFGRKIARSLLPIEYDSEMGVRVSGVLGTPETFRGSRAGQHLFVNRRFVRDRTIARALEEGYKSVQTIHGQQHPVAVVFVTVDPVNVDVNVSPTKTEVRFLREREVFSAVYKAVQRTLIDRGGLAPTIETNPVEKEESAASINTQSEFTAVWHDPFERKTTPKFEHTHSNGVGNALGYDPFDDSHGPQNTTQSSIVEKVSDGYTAPNLVNQGAEQQAGENDQPPVHRVNLESLRVLAQTRNMYILAQTNQSIVLIDQHIAHERVLYERLLKGQAGSALTIQHLAIPVSLELGRRESLLVRDRLDQIARAGFILEEFGQQTFLVRSAPASVAQKQSVESVMLAIIDELVEKTVSRRLVVPAEEVLITASCKMAVKAGDPLTDWEMRALMDDLLACDNPYTCPHGRPIMIEISNHDLDRKFGRI